MNEDYTKEIIKEFRKKFTVYYQGRNDPQEPFYEWDCEPEDLEKWLTEKLTSLSQRAYERGKDDIKAELRWSHDNLEDYCCACEYDIAGMENKIKQEVESERERLRGEVEKMKENIINSLALEINHPARIRKENTNEIINKFLSLLTPKEDKEL